MTLRISVFLLACASLGAQTYTISAVAGNPRLPLSSAKSDVWIGYPESVTTDPAGNVYFTGLHCIFKLTPAGALLRVAGTGLKGFSGDGGPATSARLFNPAGVAIDSTGTLYIADSGNHRVRRVDSDGTIATIAGTGVEGSSGDDGPAVAAQLDTPVAVAVNAQNQLFVLDFGNNRVRRVSPEGIMTAYAGTGVVGSSGDGGPALAASLGYPTDLALSQSGDLYVADAGNHLIRRISNGVITTVAGNGNRGFSGDGGLATNASLSFPDGISLDSSGNLYISDSENFRIRKVSSSGTISTVAGTGAAGFDGDGAKAVDALLNYPNDVAVDAQGNLYVADSANSRVRKVAVSGRISTVAGTDTPPLVESIDAVAIGPPGTIYFADSYRNQVFSVTNGGTIHVLAGTGDSGFSGDGADAASAELRLPLGAALDSAGNIYIADSGNQRIRKISTSGIITTIAGTGIAGFSGDGGPALDATLNFPAGLALDASGNLYIADSANHRIRRIAASGTITTVAGTGTAGFSGDGGTATSAQLNVPSGVAIDPKGDLLIADEFNGRIRRVTTTGLISTISAGLRSPTGVAADKDGNILVTDTLNHQIRRIAPNGTTTVIAGSGTEGYIGDTGPATLAQLSRPQAVAVDDAGQIVVADSGNAAVRTLLASGQTVMLAAVADAASGSLSPLSPGKIVVLYGTAMGPEQLALFPGALPTLPTELAGTVVTFNGIPAPLIYASSSQVAAIVPYGITGTTAQVTVAWQGQTSLPATLPVSPTALGLFTANATGVGQAAAINVSTGQLNTAATPVRIGEYIALYGTGEGRTTNPVDGKLAGLPLPTPLTPITATVGGVPAVVQYAGGVFGTVAGLTQINVLIPPGTPVGGYVPVVVKTGNAESPAGVWISVAAR